MSGSQALSKPAIFYGWFVVAAAFTVAFVGFGSAYTFSAFVEPLQREFAASRGSTSLVFSLAGFLYFCLGAISGPLADRWGARCLAVAGMLLTALGLAIAGAARSLAEVYAAYGLGVGLGVGCAFVPALGAVQRWFVRRRGLASGLAVSGVGVGTLVMPPLASLLIATLGWRQAYLVLGTLVAVAGVGMALMIVGDPCHRGLGPDGDALLSAGPPQERPGVSTSEAIVSRRFVLLYVACLMCSLGVFVPFVHLVPYAIDHGVAPSSAALLLSAIGAGSTAGRFALGGIADRMGRQCALVATFIGIALSFAVWALSTVPWALAVFALAYGVFYGGWVAVLPAIVSDWFGGRNASGIIGALFTSVALGSLIGPSAAGFAFDLSHSYAPPIVAGACANIIAAAIVAAIPKVPVPTSGAGSWRPDVGVTPWFAGSSVDRPAGDGVRQQLADHDRIDIGVRQLLPPHGGVPYERAWQPALDDLEARAIDIAFVPIHEIPARFAEQALYEEEFVIASRAGHPYAKSPSLKRFCEMRHLLVSLTGDAHSFVDMALAERGLKRRIELTVPNFMMALAIIAARAWLGSSGRPAMMSANACAPQGRGSRVTRPTTAAI